MQGGVRFFQVGPHLLQVFPRLGPGTFGLDAHGFAFGQRLTHLDQIARRLSALRLALLQLLLSSLQFILSSFQLTFCVGQ